MSFGNSTIFPFPAVQYIPLALSELKRDRLPALSGKVPLQQLIIGPEVEKYRSILARDFQINLPPSYAPHSLPLLAMNLQIDDVKYRGYFVTMTGKALPGFYQLATIPSRYFYKKNLFFELYDTATSKRLARQSLNL